MTSLRSRFWQLGALALVITPLFEVGGCAFADVTDYEIAACNPDITSLEQDACNRLNSALGAEECSPWQCDRTTLRCVRSARDFDRDGDPARECGGRDCNDRVPTVASTAKEVCDAVDNDCDGIVDEEVFGAAGIPTDLFKVEQASSTSDPAISGPVGGEALAIGDAALFWNGVYLGAAESGTCIKTSPLLVKEPQTTCAFLGDEPQLQPRYPFVRSFGVGQGAVFVATSLCPAGALHYRYASSGQPVRSMKISCNEAPALKGAALPNLEYFRDGGLAVIAYYDEPLPDLAPSTACDAIASAPAPLHAIAVASPTTAPSVQLVGGQPLVLSTGAKSRARPALARIDVDAPNRGALLVASPDEDGASLWALSEEPDGAGFRLSASPSTRIQNMNDSRSVSLGVAKTGNAFKLAAVSDIGCTAQSIRVSFGTLSAQVDAAPTIVMSPAVDVAAGGASARLSPSVRWVTTEQGSFWIVAWLEPGGQVLARRYAADGSPVGEAFSLARGASIIEPALDGRMLLFAPAGGVNASAFQSVPMGCTAP